MTTVEYYKHVPIVCDEIIPDSVRRDCKNHDFYILVPFLRYQHLNVHQYLPMQVRYRKKEMQHVHRIVSSTSGIPRLHLLVRSWAILLHDQDSLCTNHSSWMV